jgi:hypothetical protein
MLVVIVVGNTDEAVDDDIIPVGTAVIEAKIVCGTGHTHHVIVGKIETAVAVIVRIIVLRILGTEFITECEPLGSTLGEATALFRTPTEIIERRFVSIEHRHAVVARSITHIMDRDIDAVGLGIPVEDIILDIVTGAGIMSETLLNLAEAEIFAHFLIIKGHLGLNLAPPHLIEVTGTELLPCSRDGSGETILGGAIRGRLVGDGNGERIRSVLLQLGRVEGNLHRSGLGTAGEGNARRNGEDGVSRRRKVDGHGIRCIHAADVERELAGIALQVIAGRQVGCEEDLGIPDLIRRLVLRGFLDASAEPEEHHRGQGQIF